MIDFVLLGAGASIDADIPGSFDMSKAFANHDFGEDWYGEKAMILNAIRFIAGGLAMKNAIKGEDPFHGVDIEELFNAAKMLSEREDIEAAPFISSWHPAIVALEKPRPRQTRESISKVKNSLLKPFRQAIKASKAEDLDFREALESIIGSRTPLFNMGRNADVFHDIFERAVENSARLPIPGEIFSQVLKTMVSMLPTYIWLEEPSKILYLEPLLRYCLQRKVPIATLNYDNTIELCGKIHDYEIDTGMSQWTKTGQLDFSDDESIRYLKLHGSINWRQVNSQSSATYPISRPLITVKDLPTKEESLVSAKPAIIFGERNKLTIEGPYPALLQKFQELLDGASHLGIIGYSFRDKHINHCLIQWLNGKQMREIDIVSPDFTLEQIPFINERNSEWLSKRVRVISKTAKVGGLDALLKQ